VVLYKNLGEIKAFLDAAAAQTHGIDLMIMADNTPDESQAREIYDFCASYFPKFGETLYIRSAANYGSAAGFAMGMHAAVNQGADYIWLNDQDGIPDPDCLENLLKRAEAGPDGVYVPKAINHDREFYAFCANIGRLGNYVDFTEAEFDSGKPIDSFSTSGVLISRAVMEKSGVFRYNACFVGGEDTEYSFRIRRHGFRIFPAKSAVYMHPQFFKRKKLRLPIRNCSYTYKGDLWRADSFCYINCLNVRENFSLCYFLLSYMLSFAMTLVLYIKPPRNIDLAKTLKIYNCVLKKREFPCPVDFSDCISFCRRAKDGEIMEDEGMKRYLEKAIPDLGSILGQQASAV